MYPFGSKIRTSLSTKCAAGGNQCANENSRQWPKLHFISKVSRETIIYAEYMQPASITILWTDNGIKWSHHYDSFADQGLRHVDQVGPASLGNHSNGPCLWAGGSAWLGR